MSKQQKESFWSAYKKLWKKHKILGRVLKLKIGNIFNN